MKASFDRHLQRLGAEAPALHLVLGSGLAAALDPGAPGEGWREVGEIPFAEVEGLVAATAPGHAGVYWLFQHRESGRVLSVQRGRLHGYEGHPAREAVRTVMLPRLAGTRDFILTNMAGGLAPGMRVGSAMVIRDHLNFTGQNPLVGANPMNAEGRELGPRFPDLGLAYDPEWSDGIGKSLAAAGLETSDGVYAGLLGPSFETPAEVEFLARQGAGAVGMSTVWETIALRHSGARVAAVSLISNEGCGLGGKLKTLSHEQILRECERASGRIVEGLLAFCHARLAGPGGGHA